MSKKEKILNHIGETGLLETHKELFSKAWWVIPTTSTLWRLNQNNSEFKASLGHTARLQLKNVIQIQKVRIRKIELVTSP